MIKTERKHFTNCLAVDSDGCVFDSMRVKQESCFIPRLIETWNFRNWKAAVTDEALHLNLYSDYRGENRFVILLKLFETLRKDTRLAGSPIAALDLQPLRKWVRSGDGLSIDSLEKALEANEAPILREALRWTLAVNRDIAALPPSRPFPNSVDALRAAGDHCEIRVVSSANRRALEREWSEAGLLGMVHSLNGQEQGRKEDMLRKAAGAYSPDRVLMIGDAPADRRAAEAAGVHFYLIRAGREQEDWEYLHRYLVPLLVAGKGLDALVQA